MDTRNYQPLRNKNTRGTIVPPVRINRTSTTPTPPVQPSKPEQPMNPKDLARVRENLGFDDIPMEDDDMEHVRFRDIFRAWAKQAVKDSPIEKRLKNAQKKKGRLNGLKNDLKWALQADLDEPVKPSSEVKPDPTQSTVKATTPALRPAPHPASDSNKTIDINISLGSLPKLPRFSKITATFRGLFTKVRHFRWSRRRLIVAAAALVIGGVFVAWHFIPGLNGVAKTNFPSAPSTGTAKKPDYTTALPEGKSIESLGGWHRVSPPNRSPVFAYADKIGGIPINVSQQPIPDSFKPDVDNSVEELAKSYTATEKVSAGSIMLYIGTSAQGPQSVIFEKDGLLILMKSTKKIDNNEWANYVQSLTK